MKWSSRAWSLLTAVALVGVGCSKSERRSDEQALGAIAAKAIAGTLTKPDRAVCEIKFSDGMTSRNDPDVLIGGMRAELLCPKTDASAAVLGCWKTLQSQKAGLTREGSFPECLTIIDGRITRTNGITAGLRFRCGELSTVVVKKLEALEPTRVRVTYVLEAKKEQAKVDAIERACGEVTTVPSEASTALLLKDGEHWTVAGR